MDICASGTLYSSDLVGHVDGVLDVFIYVLFGQCIVSVQKTSLFSLL